MPAEAAPGEFNHQPNPALPAAIERRHDAAMGQRLAVIEIDSMRRKVLSDYDECSPRIGKAVVTVGSQMDWIRIGKASFAPPLWRTTKRLDGGQRRLNRCDNSTLLPYRVRARLRSPARIKRNRGSAMPT